MITFKTSNVIADEHPATLLEFDLGESGVIEPSEMKALSLPKIRGDKGVIISGRGPVWLFAHLMHQLHITRWTATFDPRQGAVVVSTHHPDAPSVGSVLSLPKSE